MTDLQWTTIGLLPVLRCTLHTSSTTLVMVRGSEHLPWALQFCMWNWVTLCLTASCCVKEIQHTLYACTYTTKISTHLFSAYGENSSYIAIILTLLVYINWQFSKSHISSARPVLVATLLVYQSHVHQVYQTIPVISSTCSETYLTIFMQIAKHDNNSTLLIQYHLQKISCSFLHRTLSHNVCSFLLVTLTNYIAGSVKVYYKQTANENWHWQRWHGCSLEVFLSVLHDVHQLWRSKSLKGDWQYSIYPHSRGR